MLTLKVILSKRCYAAICYAVKKSPMLETGGILLGYREKRQWVAIENVFSGLQSISEKTYFSLDEKYVNYQSNIYANLYKKPLEILGFWHSHPTKNMPFSPKDRGTNERFVKELKESIISGIAYIENNRVGLSLFIVDKNKTNKISFSVKRLYRYFQYCE